MNRLTAFHIIVRSLLAIACANSWQSSHAAEAASSKADIKRLLYVATPGVRNYLEYGGHGLLVFDIDNGHKFVKRIKTAGLDDKGAPLNVKGICASAATGKIYISTTKQIQCIDLISEKMDWEKTYEGGCDRLTLSIDGKTIYCPSFEGPHWLVIDAKTGDVIAKASPNSSAHNTVTGPNGKEVYLAGRRSPLLSVLDTTTNKISKTVGPFSHVIRPLTVDGRQKHVYVNVDELLGFEIGDLETGKKLHRVEVTGYKQGKVKRHSCPSHGIGLTPNEKEVWVCDAFNETMHVFDATVMPPKQVAGIKVRDQPGWISFSIDGKLAYPSTGDVIDVASRKIIATLTDETGAAVHSEKLLEIDFVGVKPVKNGDQFGVGEVGVSLTNDSQRK